MSSMLNDLVSLDMPSRDQNTASTAHLCTHTRTHNIHNAKIDGVGVVSIEAHTNEMRMNKLPTFCTDVRNVLNMNTHTHARGCCCPLGLITAATVLFLPRLFGAILYVPVPHPFDAVGSWCLHFNTCTHTHTIALTLTHTHTGENLHHLCRKVAILYTTPGGTYMWYI